MKKIIFVILLLISSIISNAQLDSTISITVSEKEISKLNVNPLIILNSPNGYIYCITRIIVYAEITSKYLPVNLLLTYKDCDRSVVNLSQILSVKGNNIFTAMINTMPSGCHFNKPLLLSTSGNVGSGNGKFTIYITYLKVKI